MHKALHKWRILVRLQQYAESQKSIMQMEDDFMVVEGGGQNLFNQSLGGLDISVIPNEAAQPHANDACDESIALLFAQANPTAASASAQQ